MTSILLAQCQELDPPWEKAGLPESRGQTWAPASDQRASRGRSGRQRAEVVEETEGQASEGHFPSLPAHVTSFRLVLHRSPGQPETGMIPQIKNQLRQVQGSSGEKTVIIRGGHGSSAPY